MNSNEEQVRAAIAEQASEWFITNSEGPLDEVQAAALAAWLKTSPVHVEEFLGVAAIAQDLKAASADSEFTVEAIVKRARATLDPVVQPLWPRMTGATRAKPSLRWSSAAAAMAACALLCIGLLLQWNLHLPARNPSSVQGTTALHFMTRHGEQRDQRLADNSVLHLDTDSAVTVRYEKNERLVILTAGRANFDVVHDRDRAFRVMAGSAEVVDIGTKFDVSLEHNATVITVVEGLVAVGASPSPENTGANHSQSPAPQFIQVSANQQIQVNDGEAPGTPTAVDAQRATAWTHRQIAFDHETLEHVAAEFNRYAPKPIEIAAPALRNLRISGVFATDDPEAFVAFLRSLKGVRVEVTDSLIRVW